MEGARQELDGVRLLMTELQSQTSGLQAQVRSLEADLAAINRYDTWSTSYVRPDSGVTCTAPSTSVTSSCVIYSGRLLQ